jgi:hypothetical protein
MVEEGEQPEESSLLIEGWLPQAELSRRELEDPNLEGAAAIGGEKEPLRPQELAHSKGVEET